LISYFLRPFIEGQNKGGVRKSRGSPKATFGRPKVYRSRVRFQFHTEKKTLEEFKKICRAKGLYANRVLTAYMENFNGQEAAVKDRIKLTEQILKTRR